MNYFLLAVTILNGIAVLIMIFKERKKPEIIISWLLLFIFIPIFGFIAYILFGSGLSIKNRKMLKRKRFYNDNYTNYFRQIVDENELSEDKNISNLIKFNIINSQSVPTFNNKIHFFTDGKEKMDSLLSDIKNAKHSINMEYYIFQDDIIGKRVMAQLCKKAQEGIKVKLIYDSVGCLGSPRKFFRQLKNAGGEVKEFFPPLFYIRLINLKMNYRNHRKIAVIDGKIGYVGGINIRKDHTGHKKRLSPWRDAHIRIEGQAVYALQNTFFNFWQFCNKKNEETKEYVDEGYFPKVKSNGKSIVQVLTSGPDQKNHSIKENMIKMINLAEKQIIIQTPYFVPDEIFMLTLKTAIKSGVKVKIILPKKPDKKFVYSASLSFAHEILEAGGEVYLYNGFMHAKTLIIDDYAVCIGSANVDNRSFELNFEINAVIYDKIAVQSYLKTVEKDWENSQQISLCFYNQRPFWIKLEQLFFRLFAPLM